ncbi:MAG: phosphoribosylanthranilate isomerase [Candidatus Omnitrophica bacterium]|nr:phosphoribosylanthranilate isomerase [Candidatus Omnitrophota bacterium]MBU4473032.1 phosphoribosylanthranilate isomerase [Candidatus Omnitrophota bacterium]MCG2706270.1 phosphoribosylanthranilate isomerase [Candidatus Omnitrophota bacterium]
MVKVKICGITNLEDALAAVGAGGDGLGFVFYKKSPRYITPQKARNIIRIIPSGIIKVAVFVNAKEETIRHIAKMCRFDILQFHGDESAGFCHRFKGYKVIKAFRIKDKDSLKNLRRYPVWAFLFDSYHRNLFGGTGKAFDWRIIRKSVLPRKNIFLSGGLNPKNIKRAIKLIKPDWLDVSSSVEINPGKKDYKKVREFIKAVRDA